MNPRSPASQQEVAGGYAKQPNPIGRPLGDAAGDSDIVSAVMNEKALKTLQRISGRFDEAFRDLEMPLG